MRTPKPPTAGSVSATLRSHNFRAAGRDREGYRSRWIDASAPTVRVDFRVIADDCLNAPDRRKDALAKMASALRRKGWLVQDEGTYLLVTAMEG